MKKILVSLASIVHNCRKKYFIFILLIIMFASSADANERTHYTRFLTEDSEECEDSCLAEGICNTWFFERLSGRGGEGVCRLGDSPTDKQKTLCCESGVVPNYHGDNLYVENECYKSVYFALKYKNTNGVWSVDGWWEIDGKDGKLLSSDYGLLMIASSKIYFYAESWDEIYYWEGDHGTLVDSHQVNMKEKSDTPRTDRYGDDTYIIYLTCDED